MNIQSGLIDHFMKIYESINIFMSNMNIQNYFKMIFFFLNSKTYPITCRIWWNKAYVYKSTNLFDQ